MQLLVGFVVAFSGGLVLCGCCCFCCVFLLEFLFDFGGIFDSCFLALNFELFLVFVVVDVDVLTFLLCTVPYHLSSLFALFVAVLLTLFKMYLPLVASSSSSCSLLLRGRGVFGRCSKLSFNVWHNEHI